MRLKKLIGKKTKQSIEKVNKIFVDLKEKHEEHQEKFMEVKGEVKMILKVEKKERDMESGGAGKNKKVKIENASNDNEVIEID
jgi:hypothetical protein